MTDYDNTNRGALFKNDKQGNAKRPDYRGTLNVDGDEFWLSAWLQTSKKGDKYMSLRVEPKNKAAETAGAESTPPESSASKDFDDDIPF